MNAQTERAGDRLMLDLRDSIRRGDLRSGARLAPLRELAEHYGVTTSKAQRVVQRLAREGLVVGRRGDGVYVAEGVATSGALARAPSGARVGMALSRFSFQMIVDPVIEDASGGAEFMRGVEDVLGSGPGSYELIPPTDADLRRAAEQGDLKTIMVLAQPETTSALEALGSFRRRGGLVILVEDVAADVDGALTIRVDAAAGMRKAVDHLVTLGHRRVAFLGWEHRGTAGLAWIDERRSACEDALAQAGLEMLAVSVPGVASVEERSAPAATGKLRSMLSGRGRPTAVVCVSDPAAEMLLSVAAHLGVAVPRELSVTGFDDAPGAIARGLTTVQRHFRDIGRLAGSLALEADRGVPVCSGRMLVEPRLVVRRSTEPPKALPDAARPVRDRPRMERGAVCDAS